VPEKRLAVDNPIDFDLQDFCSKCDKCATSRRCGEWVSGQADDDFGYGKPDDYQKLNLA
jgi:hypothetical protein